MDNPGSINKPLKESNKNTKRKLLQKLGLRKKSSQHQNTVLDIECGEIDADKNHSSANTSGEIRETSTRLVNGKKNCNLENGQTQMLDNGDEFNKENEHVTEARYNETIFASGRREPEHHINQTKKKCRIVKVLKKIKKDISQDTERSPSEGVSTTDHNESNNHPDNMTEEVGEAKKKKRKFRIKKIFRIKRTTDAAAACEMEKLQKVCVPPSTRQTETGTEGETPGNEGATTWNEDDTTGNEGDTTETPGDTTISKLEQSENAEQKPNICSSVEKPKKKKRKFRPKKIFRKKHKEQAHAAAETVPLETAAEKVKRMQAEVELVEDQMRQNVQAVIDRGEKLEVLEDKAETLEFQAQQFSHVSKKLRRRMWWRSKKQTILIASGVTGGGVIILVVCLVVLL